LTDLALTEQGEQNARKLGVRLKGFNFATVLTSPLQRARRTCELAGFAGRAETTPDLLEWNYGAYEGKRTVDIRKERPDWNLFRDGCPGGENLAAVSTRADRLVERLKAAGGDALLFAHKDVLRVFAVRWLGLSPEASAHLMLGAASLSVLGYDHNLAEPAIHLWNDDRHLD
jgi:probable phosphoglycerate mutase